MNSRHDSDQHEVPVDRDVWLDARLRQTLEPDRHVTRNVIAGAHARAARRQRNRSARLVGLTTVAAVAIAVMLVTLRPPATNPAIDRAPTVAPEITISNLDGPLTVTTSAGGRWVVLDAASTHPAAHQENPR